MKDFSLKFAFGCACVLGLLFVIGLAADEAFSAEVVNSFPEKPRTDVVLLATPIAVKTPAPDRAVDVLEKRPEEMAKAWKVVIFEIQRVTRGKFKTFIPKDPSLLSQAQDAAAEKNILKLLTMDFQRPDDTPVEKGVLSMAVSDPLASFGVQEGDPIVKQRYRLSLALVQSHPESYILVKSEKA